MSWIAVGVGAATLIGGVIQSSSASHRAKKAREAAEKLKKEDYKPSQSILDYYNTAMQRYKESSPYQSDQYQYGIQQGNRNMAAGINALQDRNSAVGGISRLTALNNENSIRQGLAAEQTESNKFGQWGAATQLMGGEHQYEYNANALMPYQQKLQLYGAQAAGAAAQQQAGWSNIGTGVSTIGSGLSNDYYGNRTIWGNGSGQRNGSVYVGDTYDGSYG